MYDPQSSILNCMVTSLLADNHIGLLLKVGRFADMMRQCIALNGSYFNTQRMMHQYVVKAYFG